MISNELDYIINSEQFQNMLDDCRKMPESEKKKIYRQIKMNNRIKAIEKFFSISKTWLINNIIAILALIMAILSYLKD